MEAIQRSSSLTEFHRLRRRRLPVPVLPPTIPIKNKSKLFTEKLHPISDSSDSGSQYRSQVVTENAIVILSSRAAAHQNMQQDVTSRNVDYITHLIEDGKTFNFLDKKKEESCETAAPTALANASTESALPPVNFSGQPPPTGLHHRSFSDGDDDTRVQMRNNRLKSILHSQPPLPPRHSKKLLSIDAQYTDASSALHARKIELRTSNPQCPSNGDAGLLSKTMLENDTINYHFRYGISKQQTHSLSDSHKNGNCYSSTAAVFFARASQKLKLNSSPPRRRKRGSISEDGASASVKFIGGFSNLLHRNSPSLPSALLRKIGQNEALGIGKVKVLMKVCADAAALVPQEGHTSVFNMDKKKKQIALYEPVPNVNTNDTDSEERKPSVVSAPKMFVFEAMFTDDDIQLELCGNALSDIIYAVINGNDGCVLCFGNSKIGKTKTMIGSCDSSATLGVIPCAISWLYKAISEQKQKSGSRFSVRVSAVEITAGSQQIKDLLTDYASDNEQSPGAYLKDDPVLGPHLQNRSELRAPLAEKAAFYLDAALSEKSTSEESHFLYTLNVYQYNVANKGTVAGGRSRLYFIDLADSDRTKTGNSMSISNLGNVLLSIFNGQKHLPHRDHKITQVLKECLSSLTCHAAIIAHVSPQAQHYHETLATVQFASRIHRIRRRKIKFAGVSNGMNTSTDENGRLTSSSDFDPSSSEQSADTVIYVGPSDETDGEHPPVHIPSLNSADNRGLLSKVLREPDIDYLRASELPVASRSVPASPQRSFKSETRTPVPPFSPIARKHHLRNHGHHSAHSSPIRTIGKAPDTSAGKLLEELWIDGPRMSRTKVNEARNLHLMRKEGQKMAGKGEMWVDGPMKKGNHELMYGFMDSHKKNMIRKWVETQSVQLQNRFVKSNDDKNSSPYKTLTVFKTYDCGTNEVEEGRGQGSGQEDETEAKITSRGWYNHNENTDYNRGGYQSAPKVDTSTDENMSDTSDEEIEIEIIEIEEPEESVPMQDSCLQVTEEDIALCMGQLENPLPEVDQEEHPLRVLSQENLTVVSTFTDSMSVVNDIDGILSRSRWCSNTPHTQPSFSSNLNSSKFNESSDKTRSQLFKLHEMYENKFDLNSCFTKHLKDDTVRAVSRCQSMMLSELCNPGENNLRCNDFENSSIASEPAYNTVNNKDDRLCENCKVSLTSIPHSPFNNFWLTHHDDTVVKKLQSYRHLKNIMNLRHPDGASNPNLQEVEGGNRKLTNGNKDTRSASDDEDEESEVPLPPPTSKLLTLTRDGFDSVLFGNHCDSSHFLDIPDAEKFCNPLQRSDHLFSPKSLYSRANIKKLQTYRVELKNKK